MIKLISSYVCIQSLKLSSCQVFVNFKLLIMLIFSQTLNKFTTVDSILKPTQKTLNLIFIGLVTFDCSIEKS